MDVFSLLVPTVLLPGLATVPLAVAGKGLAVSTPVRSVGALPLWIATCLLAWGGVLCILLVPATHGSNSWASWYFKLFPVIISALPAGMLWAKRMRRKWISVVPTFTAFLFLLLLLVWLTSAAFA